MKLSRKRVKLEKKLRTSPGTLLLIGWEDERILRRVASEVEGDLRESGILEPSKKPGNRVLPAALSAAHIENNIRIT